MEENKKIELKQEMMRCFDTDCIIADKVFASCQQRECFPEVIGDLGDNDFGRIRFRPGFIVPNTLVVTDTDEENFRRVRFTLRIPFQVLDSDGDIVGEDVLPDIFKDIIIFLPDARDEFEFRIVVETKSEVLAPPIVSDGTVVFTAGVYIIVKVVGTVQLLIPVFGYCPTPPPCDEFSPEAICEDFDETEFPDFFPPQMGDILR